MDKGFCCLASGVVVPEWIDQNGHMNVVRYMEIFNEGTFTLMRRAGFSDASLAHQSYTIVASRINIVHRKELLCDDPWQLDTGLITVASRCLTVVHRLSSKGAIRAYCYIRGAVFCKDQRVAVALSDVLLVKLKHFVVPGLKDPFDGA